VLFIKNIIKIFGDILNRNIYRGLTLIKRLSGNRFNSVYFADQITMRINRLIKNEFIPNPFEHLYIEVSNICNLRCKFCAYSKSTTEKSIMSNEMFFNIVNSAINFGYDTFGLTPITGEVFVDRTFIEKLSFLEKNQKVKSYSFFTNFTLANKEIIDWLISAKKLNELYISLYGHDFNSFSKFTGGNEKTYQNLISNLKYLLKYLLKRTKSIDFDLSFGLRTSLSFNSLDNCNSDLCKIIKAILKQPKSKISINKTYYNWGGYITQDDVKDLDIIINDPLKYYKNGACSLIFYKNQVLVDGQVNACACRDVNITLKIGDLKTQSFEEIYSTQNRDYMNIIKNQQKGKFNPICTHCDFYRSIYKDYKVYHKYKKKQMGLKNFYQYLRKN